MRRLTGACPRCIGVLMPVRVKTQTTQQKRPGVWHASRCGTIEDDTSFIAHFVLSADGGKPNVASFLEVFSGVQSYEGHSQHLQGCVLFAIC